MARRATSNVNVTQLIIAVCLVILVGIFGYRALQPGSSTSKADGKRVGDLDLKHFLENSNALSGNSYEIEGVIDERLDNWDAAQGRLFSVTVEENFVPYPVPVLIPEQFGQLNVQRGQRFRFKVTIQSGTGLMEATEVTKA